MIGVEQPTGRLRTINFTASEIRGTDGFGERAVGVRAHMMSVMQSSEIHYPFLVSVVTPPASARVALAKPSQSVRPGSLTWTWVSTSPRGAPLISELNGRGVAGGKVADRYLDNLA